MKCLTKKDFKVGQTIFFNVDYLLKKHENQKFKDVIKKYAKTPLKIISIYGDDFYIGFKNGIKFPEYNFFSYKHYFLVKDIEEKINKLLKY